MYVAPVPRPRPPPHTHPTPHPPLCSWDGEGKPVFGQPAGEPPGYNYTTLRRPHPTLNYNQRLLNCSVEAAPDGQGLGSGVLPAVHHWGALVVLAVCSLAVYRWRAKAAAGGGGNGGGWMQLPQRRP